MSDPAVPGDVPDELVELAAKVMVEHADAEGVWNDIPETARIYWRDKAQAVVAVVLPVVRQQIANEIRWYRDGMHSPAAREIVNGCVARVVRGDP